MVQLVYSIIIFCLAAFDIGKAIMAVQGGHPMFAGWWIMAALACVIQIAIIFWHTYPF